MKKKDALNYFAKSGKLKSLSKLGNYVHGVFMVQKLKLLDKHQTTGVYQVCRCLLLPWGDIFLGAFYNWCSKIFILGVFDRENPTRKH